MCHSSRVRIARITKSEAARRVGISRRSVIRYAQTEQITQDGRGRVLLSEVRKAWLTRSSQGDRWWCRPPAHKMINTNTGATSGYRLQKRFMSLYEAKQILGWARDNGHLSRGSRRRYFYRHLHYMGGQTYLEAMKREKAVRPETLQTLL